MTLVLQDGHGRTFEYLRLSLTDVCNFRCSYCLPNGYQKKLGTPPNLSVDEIRRLVTGFARLGLWKVRLTGGEPTLRDEFLDIARTVADIPGIRRLAMTTNGYRLAERAADYAAVGISALNVSVDSLDPKRFLQITGHDRLAEIQLGIEKARKAGITSIKLNAVLMRDVNDDELEGFIHFVQAHGVALRFIEVMQTNDNVAFFEQHHLSGLTIADRLSEMGWQRVPREPGAGPAIVYSQPDLPGEIGIIAPYSKDFCSSCNRLRVSATGKFHLCLFSDHGIDLRPLLQTDAQEDLLVERIINLTGQKAPTHRLHEGNSGGTAHFASIGG